MPTDDFTVEDINQLKTLHTLLKRKPLLQLSSEKTTILVIGNTGAGKSSIIDMLIDETETCRPTIGLNPGRSQTALPEIFVDKVNPNILYVDCPGFEDTRRNSKPALALLMQSLVHNNAIKGILIMIDTRSFGDKAMGLLKLLATLNQLLKRGVPIETACTFGIIRISPEPAAGTQPDPEAIYSLDSLSTVLENLRLGFQEDLAEEMLQENAQQQTGNEVNSSKYARELADKMSMIVFLQNAILASRVVLVHNTTDKKPQVCENLRRQFQLLSNGEPINQALNFENYDIDRVRLMDKVLKKSTALLTILEQEHAAIKQRDYLVNSNTLESSEQRLEELNKDIKQKEHELSLISSRETASEPFWTETKSVVTEDVYVGSNSPEGGITYQRGSVSFSYPGSAPISKIELIGGYHFNYLKTFWNNDKPLVLNIAKTISITPMRLAVGLISFGLSELVYVGLPAFMDNYKFSSMLFNGKNTVIDKINWVENITLPAVIEPSNSVFSVDFEGVSGGKDCYDRKPTVKVYVPICYMAGNQEQIVSLNNALVVLRQQAQTNQTIILRSREALGNTGIPRNIQENVLTDKALLLTQTEDKLTDYAEQIGQQQELITLIVDVFSMLRIPLHENITQFIQLWDNRLSNPRLIEAPQENGVEKGAETAAFTSQKILSSAFKNSIYALFRQNQHFTIQPSETALTIQRTQPTSKYSATFFNDAKQKFEQLMSMHPEYSLKKHSDDQWSIEGETPSIVKLRDEFELIAREKRLANLRTACAIS